MLIVGTTGLQETSAIHFVGKKKIVCKLLDMNALPAPPSFARPSFM